MLWLGLPTPHTSKSWKNVVVKNDQNGLHSKVLPLAFPASTTNFGYRPPPIENTHTWLGNNHYMKTFPLQPFVASWTLHFMTRRYMSKSLWLSTTTNFWLRFLNHGWSKLSGWQLKWFSYAFSRHKLQWPITTNDYNGQAFFWWILNEWKHSQTMVVGYVGYTTRR